ncbi:MAG: hypothetical protein ACHP7O_03535, partial [Burkholderiales bacterium]
MANSFSQYGWWENEPASYMAIIFYSPIVIIQPLARVRSAFWGKIASASRRTHDRRLLASYASGSHFIESLALPLPPQ